MSQIRKISNHTWSDRRDVYMESITTETRYTDFAAEMRAEEEPYRKGEVNLPPAPTQLVALPHQLC